MNMQDKEMDALFRSKLDDYEIEPSPMVWANISEELGAPGQRKSIIPMLRIAASIAVIIGAGAYFWPKQQSVAGVDKPKQMAINTGAKPAVNTSVNTPQTVQPAQPVNTAAPVQRVTKTQPKQVYASVPRQQSTLPSQPVTGTNNQQTTVTAPVTGTQPQQVLAAVTNTQTTGTQVVSPITAGSAITPVVPEIKLSGSLTDIVNAPIAIASADVPAKKHNKIRGLGGLLNAAIGLVDRREDKVIEFTNNEDGDTITGINLGVVAIKKNNK